MGGDGGDAGGQGGGASCRCGLFGLDTAGRGGAVLRAVGRSEGRFKVGVGGAGAGVGAGGSVGAKKKRKKKAYLVLSRYIVNTKTSLWWCGFFNICKVV